jgi:hypothetical protein
MICTKQCLYLVVVEKYHYELHIVIEGSFGGNEQWGGSVACGDAILISMSRDRPGLSGVNGDGGKKDGVLERVAETGQKYIPFYRRPRITPVIIALKRILKSLKQKVG